MKSIKQKVENKYYEYDPDEFMPVFQNGELINKSKFHIYKAKVAIRLLAHYAREITPITQ